MCRLLLQNPDLNSFIFSWIFVEGSVNNFKGSAIQNMIHTLHIHRLAGRFSWYSYPHYTTNHKRDNPLPVVLTQICIELKRNASFNLGIMTQTQNPSRLLRMGQILRHCKSEPLFEVNSILFIHLKIYP